MSGKSTQIALGGIFSALCLLLMFFAGIIPFSTFAAPALAGAMLVAVMIETGRKVALAVYAGVSILSVFIVPDREAAMVFIVFCGYYPLLKELLERIRFRPAEFLCKAIIFNAALAGGYVFLTYAFGFPPINDELAYYGKHAAAVFIISGNATFFIYDSALSRYISVYIRRFRPRFLKNKPQN